MENENLTRDKKLADRGWVDLRATLDREMPEKRRRRRFLWLWWLLPALLASGGTALWWQQSQPGAAPPPALPQTEAPVAAVPQPQQPVASLAPLAPADAVPARAAQRSYGIEKTGMDAQTPATGIRNASAGAPSTVPAPVSEKTPAMPAVATEPVAGVPVAADAIPHQSLENEPVAVQALQPSAKPALFSGLPTGLTPLTGPLPRVDAAWAIADPVTKPVRAHKSPWSFGLTAGVSTRGFDTAPGLTAGLTTDLRFGRKWGLRSGLEYGFEHLPAAQRTVVILPVTVNYDTTSTGSLIVEDVIFPGDTVAGATAAESAPGAVWASVVRVHRLEMPLLVWWQPLRHWRFYAGGSLAKTLWAQTDEPALVNGNAQTQSFDLGQLNSQKSLNNLATQSAPSWQVGWQTGVGFRAARNLEVDFFAQNMPDWKVKSFDYTNAFFDPGGNADAQSLPVSQRKWRFRMTATWLF